MSLYYETAAIITNSERTGGSLKSRIFRKKDLKNSPAKVYALATEATKWSPVLKEVIENSGVLKGERKLTPVLATLLTHDLLLSKTSIAAPTNHPLRLAIARHKARLAAELTKARIRRGFATLDFLRASINSGDLSTELKGAPNGVPAALVSKTPPAEHPRWIRINTLRTSLEDQLVTSFSSYKQSSSLSEVLSASAGAHVFHVDTNIPNLIALPPRTDFSKHPAYISGQLIMQDKASCFPAYLLDVPALGGNIVDACAAPGNKTTHLASILAEDGPQRRKQRIIACERDKLRAGTLQKMVNLTGANGVVSIKAGQDFMGLDPADPEFANVTALLLDPSCSGSGIVGRDDEVHIALPSLDAGAVAPVGPQDRKSRKRKRGQSREKPEPSDTPHAPADAVSESPPEAGADETDAALQARLASLSAFQLRLLLHAFSFPSARRITYSTCSIHFVENEGVVLRALASPVAQQRGWRILRRAEQVSGMREWGLRGDAGGSAQWENGDEGLERLSEEVKKVVVEACIRCEKGTEEGTMGFFVAAFVREGGGDGQGPGGREEIPNRVDVEAQVEDEEAEWSGLSDDAIQTPPSKKGAAENRSSKAKRKGKAKRKAPA